MPPTTPPTMGPTGVDEPEDGGGAALELVAGDELVWLVWLVWLVRWDDVEVLVRGFR